MKVTPLLRKLYLHGRLVGAEQVARLDKVRTHKGKTKPTQMWLTTSRDAQALPPLDFLNARRSEWGIENGLHYSLDVSGDEDRRLKVGTPNSLWVLALLSRVSIALFKRGRKKRQTATLGASSIKPAALGCYSCCAPLLPKSNGNGRPHLPTQTPGGRALPRPPVAVGPRPGKTEIQVKQLGARLTNLPRIDWLHEPMITPDEFLSRSITRVPLLESISTAPLD